MAIPQTDADPVIPPVDPREPPVSRLRMVVPPTPTPESIAYHKGKGDEERAQSGLPPAYFARFDRAQMDEHEDVSILADSASKVLGDGRLEHLTRPTQHLYRSLATFLSRSRFLCWRQRATAAAERNMEALFTDGDLGALSVVWERLSPNERQHAIGWLRRVCVAGYVSTLDGTAAIPPGQYEALCQQGIREVRR
jgi:hypothetical protein